MSKVYECQVCPAEQRLLLALAEHAGDDGDHCWPSVPRLAWKLGLKRRAIQRMLRKLEANRWIEAVRHHSGGRGNATEYRIFIHRIPTKPAFVKGVVEDALFVLQRASLDATKGVIATTPQPPNRNLEGGIRARPNSTLRNVWAPVERFLRKEIVDEIFLRDYAGIELVRFSAAEVHVTVPADAYKRIGAVRLLAVLTNACERTKVLRGRSIAIDALKP